MKKGAILVSSIELADEILNSNTRAKYRINNYFKKNKFAGAKDKKKITDLVFKFLKNYFSLKKKFEISQIEFSLRNGILLLYFYYNKLENFKIIYEGKFSLVSANDDIKIFKLARSNKEDIIPSLPKWIEDKLTKEFKLNLQKNYQSILDQPRFDIRINKRFTDRNKVLKLLHNNEILSHKTTFSPVGITLEKRIIEKTIKKIRQNFFEVQDEASQIVTIITGAKSGMKVLDYCAGKGTKTLALLDIMNSKGEIFVNDVNTKRLDILKKRVKSLKSENIINVFTENKKFMEYFDLILLDVPCSGSGVWRRRPENMVKLDLGKHLKNIKIQSQLLEKASKYCKKGGTISYITCSILEDENEKQIKKFLLNNKAFQILDINIILKDKFYKLNLKSSEKWLTILPNYLNTDGFFICLLKKYA